MFDVPKPTTFTAYSRKGLYRIAVLKRMSAIDDPGPGWFKIIYLGDPQSRRHEVSGNEIVDKNRRPIPSEQFAVLRTLDETLEDHRRQWQWEEAWEKMNPEQRELLVDELESSTAEHQLQLLGLD